MQHVDPDLLERSRLAFTTQSAMTMADIRAAIVADTSLSPVRRRDLMSAMNGLERHLDQPLDRVDATPTRLRSIFAGMNPARLRKSEKTIANWRSLIASSLQTYGRPPLPLTKRFPIDPVWKALLDRIEIGFQKHALYRLAVYCSIMRIPPDQVQQETLIGLHAALEAEEVVKNPYDIIRNTIANWNRSKRTVDGWPEVTLHSPFRTESFTLPLEAFPLSFQADVASWRAKMLDPAFDDEDAPPEALRMTTVDYRVMEFRQFASALVRCGQLKVDDVLSLATLFRPENFQAAVRVFHGRHGKTQRLHNLARSMRLVAKHHCRFDEQELAQLDRICHRLSVKGRGGITERNYRRLLQFDDPKNVRRLLRIPEQLASRAKRETSPDRSTRFMERALMLALLIHGGLRLQTLRTLKLEYFHMPTPGTCHLFIPGHAMKADRPLELVLDSEVYKLWKDYLATYRSRRCRVESDYLFPGLSGGPRSTSAAYKTVCSVLKRAGLDAHPHLIRHAIAKICVERDPGAAFAVSRVLGHSSLTTTTSYYLGTESKAAGRYVDKLLADARHDGADNV